MEFCNSNADMPATFTTRQAAKKLGLDAATLSRYISSGKIPAPQLFKVGDFSVHSWTEQQIEAVRKLLPRIANGRKTWREKKQLALSPRHAGISDTQQSVKPKPKKSKH